MKRRLGLQDHPLYKKASETVVGLVLTFVLSVGLIGGFSYLFLESKDDLDEMREITLEFQQESIEYGLATDMVKVMESGWLSDTKQVEQLLDLVDDLDNQRTAAKLDPAFEQSSLNWCFQSLRQLAFEKGKIVGFTFAEEDTRLIQSSFAGYYDPYIDAITQLTELVIGWEEASPERRTEQLRTMKQALGIALNESFGYVEAAKNQQEALVELKNKTRDLKLEKGEDAYRRWRNKTTLSIVGIIVGVVILVFFAYSLLKPSRGTSVATRSISSGKKRRK